MLWSFAILFVTILVKRLLINRRFEYEIQNILFDFDDTLVDFYDAEKKRFII